MCQEAEEDTREASEIGAKKIGKSSSILGLYSITSAAVATSHCSSVDCQQGFSNFKQSEL